MFEKSFLDCDILSKKPDVERALITKQKKKEIVDHIFQGDNEFTYKKEKSVQRRPTTYQVPKTFSVSKAFQIPGYCHWFQDTSLF